MVLPIPMPFWLSDENPATFGLKVKALFDDSDIASLVISWYKSLYIRCRSYRAHKKTVAVHMARYNGQRCAQLWLTYK